MLNVNDEIWVDIEGFEGYYQISNRGNARSLKNNHGTSRIKMRVPVPCKKGYLYLLRSVGGVASRDSYHRLVAKHFIPNPEDKQTVNHIDGNKANNDVNNLEWATLGENLTHAYATGLKVHTGHGKGKKWGNSSDFYNVTYDVTKDRWIASIKHDKKSYAKHFTVKTHGEAAERMAALAVNNLLDQLGITDRPRNVIY